MEATKFRKKPVTIEAIQWTGKAFSTFDVDHFVGKKLELNDQGKLLIPTLEGIMEASMNDWIIKGVNGEFYPCKPDIFEKTYELA